MLYRQLISDFPSTPAAQQAGKQIKLIVQQRQKVQQQAAIAAVESIQNVVDSYQLVYRHWPASIQELDGGEYLFNSDYMAESVSEGFAVYLALVAGKSGYRLWSFPLNAEVAYLQNGKGQPFISVERSKALAEIETEYIVEQAKGTVTFLLPGA